MIARAVDLAKRIGSPEQSGIADVAEFMMLQLLNRSQMHFSHRARLHTLHPETFYLDLTQLLGELMTFTENSRLPCKVEPYDHRDLTYSFKTVIPELRRALNIVLQPRAQNLPLVYTEGVYLATVNEPGLFQSGAFVPGPRPDATQPAYSPVYPTVKNRRHRQNPQHGQRTGARHSTAHTPSGTPTATLPRRLCLF